MFYSKEDRRALEYYVGSRIERIQSQLTGESKRPRAQLAQLRRAVALRPGELADTWEIEIGGLPTSLVGKGDEDATPGEWASHLALGLYAVHQQSVTLGMCRKTKRESSELHGLGHAASKFASICRKNNKGEQLEQDEMPRRFAALVTAQNIEEVAHYARQLVQQLKVEEIPLDYGGLAGQLYAFQFDQVRDRVRLEWAREFSEWYHAEDTIDSSNE